MRQRVPLLVLPLFLLVLGTTILIPAATASSIRQSVNARSSVSVNGIRTVRTLAAAPYGYNIPAYGDAAWQARYRRAIIRSLLARRQGTQTPAPVSSSPSFSFPSFVSSSSSSSSSSSPAPRSSSLTSEVGSRSSLSSSSSPSTQSSAVSLPSSIHSSSSSAQSVVSQHALDTDRREVLRIVNEERANAELSAYAYNTILENSAQAYTENMRSTNCFSHTCGSTLRERMHASGYYQAEPGRTYSYGENIAVGQTTPSQVMRDWMNSPSHRSAILSTQYLEIGIGRSGNYWTLHFGAVR